MITLLEFAKRTRHEYVENVIPEFGGLCMASSYATSHFAGEGYSWADLYDLERLLDGRVSYTAPKFGGKQLGYFWPEDESEQRLACLDHIIEELENESNQG